MVIIIVCPEHYLCCRYFKFVMLPRQPSLVALPTPNDVKLTTPPFCSLRVGVVISVEGVTNVQVTAISQSSDGAMLRVVRIQGGGGDEGGEDGSGGSGECVDCDDETTYISCIEVSCDYQVINIYIDCVAMTTVYYRL